jgi:dTDP-4-amino-4,6-dideoxygalactose transaminase
MSNTKSTPPFIPPANPLASYLAQREEIDAAIKRVLTSGWYILGREVQGLEEEFAAWLGVGFAVGAASGTDALELALRAYEIGPGDLVFTVSHTAVATVAAIDRCGATPVLVDIDPRTYTMSPEKLAQALEEISRDPALAPRVRAVLPVHLYGHPADMPAILDLARKYNLLVMEDCAQAHGARLQGKMVGSLGDLGAFSFYPTKNLGGFGDGGMVVGNDPLLGERLRILRQYGWQERNFSRLPGINSRLDEVQAAILRVKLTRLKEDNERRREIARRYDAALADTRIQSPVVTAGVEHAFHQYVVRSPRREELGRFLGEQGIGTAVHYPYAVHQQPGYQQKVILGAGGLAVTETVCREVLSLPLYPQLTEEEVDRITKALGQWQAQS